MPANGEGSSRLAFHQLVQSNRRIPNEQPRPSNQSTTERCRKAPTPQVILLHGHYQSKDQHPSRVAHSHEEHQEHQRPAAADAIHTMSQPEYKRLTLRSRSMPMARHETKWGTAF